jgi:hypothetical protein
VCESIFIDGGLDGGMCNTIVPQGPAITDTCVSGEPPEPQGGTIEDGFYDLQSSAWYGGCQPTTTQTTWSICGDVWEVAQNNLASAAPDANFNTIQVGYTISPNPTSVDLTPICSTAPGEPTFTRGYTVSGANLTFITAYTNLPGSPILVGQYKKR